MGTRDRERTVIEAVLDGVGHGSTRGLLLTGEPGIGRTTLLDHARRQAAARGWLVLAAAGDPAGSEHPFDALGVLVRHAIAADASLADRLSSALEVALGVERGRAEPTAIRAAVVRLLTDAASTRPVLLALDDVQWFDGSSISALACAHRHLAAEPVVTVATTLAGDEAVERAWGRVLTP
ncbi:MAG: ATP-binding protein, partial [Actinobacteria bacterium]|nr:ATP-binding protein [Actinomycetota bacterium]